MSSTATGVAAGERPSDVVGSGGLTALGALVRGFHQRRFLVVCVFISIFCFDIARPTDIDFWWHVKTGELIARTGAVPTVDPFSYTALGRAWTDHEWLWELGAYWVTRLGGYRLAVLLSASLVTLAYAILYRALRQLGTNELVSAALVAMVTILGAPSIGVRPREMTQLFLAYYVSRLFLYREGKVRSLWGLPLAMLVWVNVHGPFILGLVVLGVFILGDLAAYVLERKALPRHRLLVGLATLAATAVNPDGTRMLLYPIGYYLQPDNPSFAVVTEFQSPNFHQPVYLLFAASLLLFMLVGGRRLNLVDALLLVGFAAPALVSVRNVAVYAIVAAPLLALRLRDALPWARELRPPRPVARLVALNWLLVAAFLAIGFHYASQPDRADRLQLGVAPLTEGLPVGGVAYVEEHNLPGPIFNSQAWGGYLEYRWYPQRPVFIDGRVDMFGTAITKEYQDVVELQPDWRQVLDKYGIQTILIDKDSALSTLLLSDAGWERVYHGDVEEIFVRRTADTVTAEWRHE